MPRYTRSRQKFKRPVASKSTPVKKAETKPSPKPSTKKSVAKKKASK